MTIEDNFEIIRGSDARLLDGFLRPNLSDAAIYRRAVGFFSSSVFAVAKDEFAEFFRRDGKIELVCSPLFGADDIHALRSGLTDNKWRQIPLDHVLQRGRATLGPAMLSWAVASGRLNLRIAIVLSNPAHSIYHEKIGVILHHDGRVLTFDGSANESAMGYVSNFERIVAHAEGRPRRKPLHPHNILQDFERLWANRTPGLEVLSLHEAFKRRLLRIRPEFSPADSTKNAGADMTVPAEILKRPPRLRLRPYQENAIRQWWANGGRGIYAMATGTGKTITALATIEELYKHVGPPLLVIIVAPYLNLVDQWIKEAKEFGLDPINCSGPSSDWTSAVDMSLYLNQSVQRPILTLVTTNATFAGDPFQRVLAKLRVRTMLIADEVHNLGARHLRRCLPERVQLRLGLSATPERYRDAEGTAAVTEYFGQVVFEYDLAAALRGDSPALCPYRYRPLLVELDDDEREEYLQITRMLAQYMEDPRDENLSDIVLSLLLRRSRLVACARRKLPALRQVMQPYRTTRFNLVYCGDGRVEVESASDAAAQAVSETPVMRQVAAVTSLLGTELGMNVSKYTSETTREVRQQVLADFENGDKQALVAIRCLDEGIDVPQVRRAFILASSTNPRQFIQRRGRVLRRAEGKDEAEIFDFIVVPPLAELDPASNEFRVMRNLVSREMARVVEFARLAVNGPQAMNTLLPVLTTMKLLHLG